MENDRIDPTEITRRARNHGRPGGGAPGGAGGGGGHGAGRGSDTQRAKHEKPEDDGDPVLLQNGSFDMNVTDLSFPGTGGTGLAFRRRYNSASGERGSLGSNWQHNFESYLQFIHKHNKPSWVPDYCTAAMPMTTCIIHHGGNGGS